VEKVFWTFGPPQHLVSDVTQAFTGAVMTEVCKLLNIKHIKTSGYQPQGNSVERLHGYMNAAITIQWADCHEYHLE